MVSIVRSFFTFLLIAVWLASPFTNLSSGVVQAQGKSVKEMAPKPVAVQAATPNVSLSGLGEVLVGEDFTFKVSFKNTGSSAGYGPFIDLVFPTNGADGNNNTDTPDGIEFISASAIGYTFNAAQTTQDIQVFPGSGAVTCVVHPWARQSNGDFVQVCGAAGDTLVSLRLPFGSVVPGQPLPDVTVNASLSVLADVDTALTIRARGGYIYGNTPLDDWCCGDPSIVSPATPNSPSWPGSPVTPKVFIFTKTYSGPDNVQDETSTGPNFARKYNLIVNIATGQTITNLEVFDKLPDNEQFISLDAGATSPGYTVTATPSTTLPGGILSVRYGSATGSAADEDLKVVFNFYIPRFNVASAPVISPTSGALALSRNIAWMTGEWVPSDPREGAESLASDSECVTGGNCTPLHTLQDKAFAIQKSVTNLTDSNPSPGDIFEYQLSFQVSDYFAFDTISVTDTISDGQHVLAGFTPTLQINGNGYNLSTASVSAANLDVSCNYTGGPGAECTSNNPVGNDGTTRIIVRVSDEIIVRGENGRMIGGCVDASGGNLSVCTPASAGDGPTQGLIIFRTVLQEAFTNDFPSGDPSVDQGDELTDTVEARGRVLNNDTFLGGAFRTDDATAEFKIAHRELTKALYAINGDTNPSNWQRNGADVEIKPNDTVTYRLTYVLNTSDVEDLALEDYLPLPVFYVNDPDADHHGVHTNGPAFIFDDSVSATAPAVGHAQFGPSDTFRAYSGIIPTVSGNTARNVLRFGYGDYDDPRNQSTTVDLLFTLTVSAEPFADRSFIANQAHQTEGSTNAGSFAQDALEWFILTQPALSTTKGVIWTNDPAAVLDPAPGIAFLPPSSTPRWNGIINSTMLAANPINSDITGLRPYNIVSFAIVVENKGSSLAGAFDIVISDVMPEIYAIPATGLNLQIYYGDGTGPIDVEVDGVVTQAGCVGGWPGNPCGPDKLANTPDDIFGSGIKLVDPVGEGVCSAYNPNLGNNVILITYDLQVQDNLKPGTYTNTGKNSRYAGHENGTNHVKSNLVWNLHTTDTAKASWIRATKLANTGFAPNRITSLPAQPANLTYTAMPNLWLELPALDVKSPIIGIPNITDGWDLTWLSDQVGFLQGTTPPTAVGNTVLTAHVYLADGSPGPFIDLDKLRWGETIILHADGYRYIYQVRSNRLVSPTNLTVFREDGYAWLTLITCKTYSKYSQSYLYRVAVRAVLLSVEPE